MDAQARGVGGGGRAGSRERPLRPRAPGAGPRPPGPLDRPEGPRARSPGPGARLPGTARWAAALCLLAAALVSCGQPAPPPDGGGGGALAVEILGLPAGAAADVRVTGPGGYEHELTSPATLSALAAGEYTLDAAAVATAQGVAIPSPASQTVEVAEGSTALARVTYALQDASYGAIAVDVNGLPAGAVATFDVAGPEGFTDFVRSGEVLGGLPPGEYRLSGRRVVATYGYEPADETVTVTVATGAVAEVQVAYAAVTGAIAVSIDGLPAGVAAGVVLSGSEGDVAVDAARTVADLPPGTYDYAAPDVATAPDETTGLTGFTYQAVRASVGPIEVAAGETAELDLGYEPVTGSLLLLVRGLPAGTPADITVAFPGSPVVVKVTGTGALNNLTFEGADIDVGSVTGDHLYEADPVGDVPISSGEVTVVDVEYHPLTGTVVLRATGLPSGVSPDVSLLVGGVELGGTMPYEVELRAGTFPVTPEDPVQVSGQSYQVVRGPLFVDVVAGEVADVVFDYAIVGDLTVEITGLSDRFDGDVRVTGPRGFDSGRIRSTTVLTDIPIGEYEVVANDISVIYYADPHYQTVVLDADGATVTVRYREPVIDP